MRQNREVQRMFEQRERMNNPGQRIGNAGNQHNPAYLGRPDRFGHPAGGF